MEEGGGGAGRGAGEPEERKKMAGILMIMVIY